MWRRDYSLTYASKAGTLSFVSDFGCGAPSNENPELLRSVDERLHAFQKRSHTNAEASLAEGLQPADHIGHFKLETAEN
jgi:hypothetical protein